jgi:hypothetical protein
MSEAETKTISYKHPTRTTVGVHTRKAPEGFIWNDKSIQAYKDIGIEVPENLCMFQKRFLAKVDVSKGPIERSVVAMVRLKAPDYLAQEKDKTKLPERREFIYYQERWEGKDWRGLPLNPVDEQIEGKYNKQFTKPHINEQTGEIDYYQLDPTKVQTIHYIPFSKKAVDDIIAKSVHTDKDKGIVFTIKFGSEDNPTGNRQMPTRNQFTYDQFVWKWEEVYKHNFKPTVQAYMEYVNKEKQKDGLSFEPT